MTQRIIFGAAEEVLPTLDRDSVDLCFTSPPYWGLRDYGTARWEGGDSACTHVLGRVGSSAGDRVEYTPGRANRDGVGALTRQSCPHCGALRIDEQLGLEPHPAQYIERLVGVFELVRPVLKRSGSLVVNLGDSYGGATGKANHGTGRSTLGPDKDGCYGPYLEGLHETGRGFERAPSDTWLRPKQLLLIPSRFAVAMQDAGWLLRNFFPWVKPNGMPSSVRDRRSNKWEAVFHFVKEPRYWYDLESIREEAKTEPHRPGWTQKYPTDAGPLERRKADGSSASQYDEPDRVWAECGLANPGDVLVIPTRPFSGAHFAVFPPALVAPWVKSCCPEKVCAQCGKGWVRQRKQTRPRQESPHYKPSGTQISEAINPTYSAHSGAFACPEWEDLGLFPSCDCDQGTVPGVVLDPFAGSCTVAEVARGLGRSSICIELNAAYRAVIEQRLGLDGELDWGDVTFDARTEAA